MKRKARFTSEEYKKIRRLLGEKVNADRNQQKTIRQQIRNLGFYISDFPEFGPGFTRQDLDALRASGRISATD